MRFRSVLPAVVACLLGGPVALRAQAAEPPVPPDAYAVLRPSANPLVKAGSKVPVPTIVWEKVAVRPDHPRLVLTKETVKEFAARLARHPMRSDLNKAVEDRDPLACAYLYQLTGRVAYAKSAIRDLLAGRTRSEAPFSMTTPYVFDWTYEAMSDEERRAAIQRVWGDVSVDRASGWPRCSPYTGYPDDPLPSATPPAQWPPFYNWTFHDQDWARRYAPTLALLVALAGHAPRAAEGVRHYWEYSLKDAVLFLDYLRDGSYWQGYYWSVTNRVQEITRVLQYMRSGCGIDYLDPQKHPYVANMGRWLLYCSDPWAKRVIYNYGDGEMVNFGGRQYMDLLASNYIARDPHVEWLLRRSAPPDLGWFPEVLYHDTTLEARAPMDLPTARVFPGTGLVVMRSGW